MGHLTDILPPLGFDSTNDICVLQAHAALTPGDLICLDKSAVSVSTDSPATGTTGLFYLTKAVPSAGTASVTHLGEIFLVCLDTIASGGRGRFQLRGTRILAKIATTSIAIGDKLVGTSGANTLSESTTLAVAVCGKILGFAMQTNSVANANCYVMFDGWCGFGGGGSL